MPRPSTLERTEVLARLSRAFRSSGFHGTTMAALASEVGLQKASLYHLFPGGKVEMARAVIGFALEGFGRMSRSGASPAERFDTLLAELHRYFGSAETACLLGNLALSKPDETLQGELRGAFGRWLRALVELQTMNGRDEATAVLAAEAAIVQLEGSLVLARGLGDSSIMGRAFASLPVLLGFAPEAPSAG